MSLHARADSTQGSAGALERAVTLYVWFALCVVGLALHRPAFSLNSPPVLASFVLPLLVIISFLSLIVARGASALMFVGYSATILFVLLAPLNEVRLTAQEQVILLVLSCFPITWLRLWSWREQVIVFSCTAIAAGLEWITIEGWRGTVFMLPYVAAAITSVTISRVQISRYDNTARTEQALPPVLLLHHAWPTTAFQAGILLTLSFSEVVLSRSGSSGGASAHFYGLASLLLGALILVIVEESKRRSVLFVMTVFVGALVSFDTARPSSQSIVQVEVLLTVLCLIMLHLSTLSLPWGLQNSLILAWILTALGVASVAFRSSTAVTPLLGILVGGLTVSLTVARAIERRRSRIFSNKRSVASTSSQSEATSRLSRLTPLRTLAREGIAARRFELLLPTLLIAGVIASVVSISLTAGISGLHLGYVSFYVLWGSILHLSRRRSDQEPLWFVAALSALLLFLWTCAMIVLSQTQDPIWLLLPAAVLVVCGLIPWRTVEVFPLLAASVVIGTTTSYHVGEIRYGLFFVASAILTWYLSANTYRKIKERFLLQEFQQALRNARSIDETLYTLADYLGTLFGGSSVLVSRGVSTLELVGEGQVYIVDVKSFDVNRLAPRIISISALERYVRIGICNWIADELRIESREFGLYAANHAVFVEIESIRERSAGADTGRTFTPDESEAVENARFVVPTELPVFRFILGDQLYLAEALAGEALLRLRLFSEERLRRLAERAAFTIQADRDYELSSLVHDINNTVQDQALLCDGVIEDLERILVDRTASTSVNPPDILRDAASRVRRIAVSSRAMAAVVSDAKRKRELDRIEDLHPRELIDVQQAVSEAFDFALVRSERRRVGIKREGEEETSVIIRVSSRDHLETALRSLLNNAVLISAPGTMVSIRTRCSAEWVWIDIQDTGPGLSQEERRALLRGEPVRHWGASDLGFSQLRRFAEAQGGSLDVASVGAGKGSLFTLLFPRQHAAMQSGRHAWALVVDDEPSLVQSYARIIKALHLEPVMAASIDEARKCVDDRSEPSLLVTDLNLGTESGLELIKYVRERYGAVVPILVVSGIDDEQVLEKLTRDEHCATVTKPVGQRLLFSKLEELLNQNKTGRIG